MRKIKFRVWHPPVTDGDITLTGYMDYQLGRMKMMAVKTETREIPEDFCYEHILSGTYSLNKDLEDYGDRLMQYTGLKDKNGNEIYEGDIIEYQNEEADTTPYEVPEITPENWEELLGIGDSEWEVKTNQYSNIEIIGNIYENPELLK